MGKCDQSAGIVTVNDQPHTSHADQLVRLCREVFGRGEAFVEKITGRVDRPLQRIREFRNRPNPCIAVTVDLLTTGVDIPDLEFLVFMRPVKSRILWEQMLGRGTRKGERFSDKSHFTVFDCFDGSLFEFFRNASAMDEDPPDKPSRTIVEIIESVWRNEDRTYNTGCLVKRLQRIDKELSGEGLEKTYIITELTKECRSVKACEVVSFKEQSIAISDLPIETRRHLESERELIKIRAADHVTKGIRLAREGKTDMAIREFNAATALRPTAVAYANLANALYERDRLEESIAACLKAIDCDRSYGPAYYNLGNVYQFMGKRADAISAFETFSRLAKDDPTMKNWIVEARKHIERLSSEK